MHRTRSVTAVLTFVLIAHTAAGCSSKGGGKDRPPATTAAAATAAATTSAYALRAAMIPFESSGSNLRIFYDDSTLAGPQLMIDRGGGFVDSGVLLDPLLDPPHFFMAGGAPAGTRLRVEGLHQGILVASNTIAVGQPLSESITIVAPAGSDDLTLAPVVQSPTEVTWSAKQADRFLLVLSRKTLIPDRTGLTWMEVAHYESILELPGAATRHALDAPALVTYRQGVRTLSPGLWSVDVIGLDAQGTPIAGSARLQKSWANHSFEVR